MKSYQLFGKIFGHFPYKLLYYFCANKMSEEDFWIFVIFTLWGNFRSKSGQFFENSQKMNFMNGPIKSGKNKKFKNVLQTFYLYSYELALNKFAGRFEWKWKVISFLENVLAIFYTNCYVFANFLAFRT